jgi:type IV pilus biogenesis protein PilP
MRNNKTSAVFVVACCIAWPATVFAQASAPAATRAGSQSAGGAPAVSVVPTPAAVEAANELMQLQEQTLLLKAQLKKLDAQAQVDEREQSLRRIGGQVTYDNVSLFATQSLGKTTSATLGMGNGVSVDVQSGDMLPNGMRVISIRPGTVVVAAPNGRRLTLAISPPSHQASLNAAAANGEVPPIPTLPMPSR